MKIKLKNHRAKKVCLRKREREREKGDSRQNEKASVTATRRSRELEKERETDFKRCRWRRSCISKMDEERRGQRKEGTEQERRRDENDLHVSTSSSPVNVDILSSLQSGVLLSGKDLEGVG